MPVSCSYCSKYQASPLRCSACHVAVYCSKECQKKHWKSHKDQCKKIQRHTGTDTVSQPCETVHNQNASHVSSITKNPSSKTNREASNGIDITKNPKPKPPKSSLKGEKCSLCKTVIAIGLDKPCQFCKNTIYCSDECQLRDWEVHQKYVCDRNKDGKIPSEKSSTSSSFGSVPNYHQTHFKAQSIFSNAASTGVSGSSNHQKNDGASARSSSPVVGNDDCEGTKKECGNCKEIGADMKSCARCSQVFYCSRACQKEDWQNHKKECSSVDGSIETKEFKKQKKEEARRQAEKERERQRRDAFDMEHVKRIFGIRSEQEMLNIPSEPCMPITEARELTSRHFKFVQIIENLAQIPQETFFFTPRNTSTVLLARISKYHEYGTRHAVYIEDSHKQETFVMFYLDNDFPEPFFRWNQVAPGNYLGFRGPFIHRFMDGTVGIRIEDPSDVLIIHKGLKSK